MVARRTRALALAAVGATTSLTVGLLSPAFGADDQTSDRAPGGIAERRAPGAREPADTVIVTQWRATRGVQVTRWREDPTPDRGRVKAQVITVDLNTRGLSVDYVGSGALSRTAPLTSMLKTQNRGRVVAAVNGDFFDIGSTGAPLGVGASRTGGLLHGVVGRSEITTGIGEATFSITRGGGLRIGPANLSVTAAKHRNWNIVGINPTRVPQGRIGVYTSAWGRTPDATVTGGRKTSAMVEVRGGKVVRVDRRLKPSRRIQGKVLIGRGKGAKQLKRMRPGKRLRIRANLVGRPRVAISGNRVLLKRGEVQVVDDVTEHPRTAIGIDRDKRRLILVTIDGRSRASRGYTMVELAQRMATLGADDALNLDGGGSSTMVSRRPETGDASLRVVNRPSDGRQRSIPNGLAIYAR